MNRSDWKIFGVLALFTTFILFFVSQDSYIYDLHSRVDSAWFFMCGKAWMNGLVPYVDFTDSKGPLLWLIYGIGYLIQHTNYLGIFWISCIWYTITYFISYKIAKLFLNNTILALSCSILMTLAFFNPWFHNEVRAEDFGLLFMNLSLYRISLLMYEENVSERSELLSFAMLGGCFGALLLMKFNIAAMQAGFIICALVYLIKEKKSFWKPILWGIIGFCSIAVPFMGYFLIEGNFTPFIQEYFIKTIQTVDNAGLNWAPQNLLLSQFNTNNPFLTYLLEWGDVIYTPEIGFVLVTIIIGGLLFRKKRTRYGWMPLIVSLWVFALTVRHHTYYYFNICSFLFIFVLIGLMDRIGERRVKIVMIASVLASLVIIPAHLVAYSFKVLIFNDNLNQRDFYRVSYVMSQVEKPKIVNAYEYEEGFGILSESLPAGKYWVKQNGMTPEMMKEHEDLILSGKADFIIIDKRSFDISNRIRENQLLERGYKEYLQFGESNNYILFSNRKGLSVKEEATPSYVELLIKRAR